MEHAIMVAAALIAAGITMGLAAVGAGLSKNHLVRKV